MYPSEVLRLLLFVVPIQGLYYNESLCLVLHGLMQKTINSLPSTLFSLNPLLNVISPKGGNTPLKLIFYPPHLILTFAHKSQGAGLPPWDAQRGVAKGLLPPPVYAMI